MKKAITSILFVVLCAACGIVAFLVLREGGQRSRQEEMPKPRLTGLADITIQEGGSLPGSVQRVQGTDIAGDVTADISQVQAGVPGTYPITYTFLGTDGKKYTEEIQCAVEARTENVPEPGTDKPTDAQAGAAVHPKTGDELGMIAYTVLALMSVAAMAGILHHKAYHKKI